VVLETTSALVALLAALLVVGRYRSSPYVRDLALVQAFIVLAVGNLLPNLLPALVDTTGEGPLLRLRLRLVCGVVAALAFAVAAIAGDLRLARRTVPPAIAAALGLLAPALGVLLLQSLDIDVDSVTAVRAMQAVAGVCFALAALGFGAPKRAKVDNDRLRSYLAIGTLIAAGSRLAAVVEPTTVLSSDLRIDDVLRAGFYAVLLAGGIDEIRSYWQRIAVHEERRRLARDLHDGVAQELAFITTEAARHRATPEQLERIGAAAARALDESRRAISALTRPLDQPLDEAVGLAAEEVAARTGAAVHLDLDPTVVVSPPVREALVRILREAVSNAARHANAETIDVVLARDRERLVLRVVDDGDGFVLEQGHDRFGIVSMSERANAIGAQLSIASELGSGTTVELGIPVGAAS
jgi:signal transduction histidine kinase